METAPNQYLLGEGPFTFSSQPVSNQWSLFYPHFFFSHQKPCFSDPKQAMGLKRNIAPSSGFSLLSEGPLGETQWCIPSASQMFSKKELVTFLRGGVFKMHTQPHFKWEKPDFSGFKNFFLKTQEKIKQKKLKKVVPVFFETADFILQTGDIPNKIYQLLSAKTPYDNKLSPTKNSDREEADDDLYFKGSMYAWWEEDKGVIGISPECLFKKKGLYVQTMALAGTARDQQHDLLTDPKEKKEHQFVVEGIKKILLPLGEHRASPTYLAKVAGLKHLRTDFKLHLKQDLSFENLCGLLHPTPALGGWPKKPALDWLREEQGSHPARPGFGAPFGVTKEKEGFCMVAIRNMQFINKKVYIGSGCGLVKESKIEREWEELKQKRETVKSFLI